MGNMERFPRLLSALKMGKPVVVLEPGWRVKGVHRVERPERSSRNLLSG